MANYLLSCDCGAQFTIGTIDAGKTLQCAECEIEVVVPNLREIRQLPEAQSSSTQQKPTWGKQNGLIFSFGVILLTLGLGLAAFEFYQANQLDLRDTRGDELLYGNAVIDQMPPLIVIEQWRIIRANGLGNQQDGEYQLNAKQYAKHQTYAIWELGGAAVGLLLCCIAFMLFKRTNAADPS